MTVLSPLLGQAGKPVAFFVSKNGASDGIDAWVATVLNAGFGTGGDQAQLDVLTRISQVQSQQLIVPALSCDDARYIAICWAEVFPTLTCAAFLRSSMGVTASGMHSQPLMAP